MNSHRASVPGSYRGPLPEAQIIGPVDADATVEATLVLRRRAELPEPAGATAMSSAELADRFGADPRDVDLVTRTVTDAGARVVEADPASRRVRVSGTARSLQSLFGTTLERAHVPDPAGGRREVRHRTGELSLPAELEGVVTAVLGLDDRPQLRARLRVGPAAAAVGTSYTPLDLARIYAMPAGTDGMGQTLAILELGGGFAQSDLDTYFSGLGLATPSVTAVGVDGAVNTPGKDPKGADGEVLLDIEVAGAIAPKAAIVVYFAPNTDAGFLDAVSAATHATPTPTAMSISWGQGEGGWTAQAATAMDQAFADAVTLGITVTAAAGDAGSSDTPGGGTASQVDFPASSPHVLGCGGTSLVADPASGTVTSETVWNDGPGKGATGGGVSVTFPLPTWQANAGVPPAPAAATTAPPAPGKTFHPGAGSTPPPASGTTPPATGTTPPGKAAAQGGRGVPDVAADADPATGYRVFVDGKAAVYGGTSAVAPLWAALVCRLAQSLKRPLGLLQPALYAAASPGVSPAGFRDITSGNNGSYQAGPGWDACTGLGVPDGTALLGALGGTATTTTAGTGTPGTPGAPGATGAPGTPGTR